MEKDKNIEWFKIDRNTMYDIIHNTDTIACMVYIGLLAHLNNSTGNCYPSLNTLATELNLSRKTIQNKINLLEEKEYIKHNSGTFGKEEGKNLANTYYFLTSDRNENVDTVAESMATKKKRTYKKKDKYNTNTEININNEDSNINTDINVNSTNENYNEQRGKENHFSVFNTKLAKYLMNNGAECVDIAINYEIGYEENMIFFFNQNKKLEELINKYIAIYCDKK